MENFRISFDCDILITNRSKYREFTHPFERKDDGKGNQAIGTLMIKIIDVLRLFSSSSGSGATNVVGLR